MTELSSPAPEPRRFRETRPCPQRSGPFMAKLALTALMGLAIVGAPQAEVADATLGKEGADTREKDFSNTRGIGGVFSPAKFKQELAQKHGNADYAQSVLSVVKILDDDGQQELVAAEAKRLSVVLDLKKLPADGGKPVSIRDGDVLRDSGGVDKKGDKYTVYFTANGSCYAYVMQLDVTGKVFPLFPSEVFAKGLTNPVEPHKLYQVPPRAGLWLYLDKNRGEESIYFLFSKKRRPKLEEKFAYFDEANKSLVSGDDRALSRSLRPFTARGIAGVQDVTKAPQATGTVATALAGASWYRPKYSELVITRWFKHQ